MDDENVVYCDECGEEIEEGEERYETDLGVLCESCYSDNYEECEFCGEVTNVDDLTWWGDCRICPDCLNEQCPDFDKEENNEETTEAYNEMLKRYVGKKTNLEGNKVHLLTCVQTYDNEISYYAEVSVDENSRITDVSRLSAEMLLSESLKSSEWKPYPIDDSDYEDIIDEMLEEYLVDDEDEDEDE